MTFTIWFVVGLIASLAIRAAVMRERERCARIADSHSHDIHMAAGQEWCAACRIIAKEIRGGGA